MNQSSFDPFAPSPVSPGAPVDNSSLGPSAVNSSGNIIHFVNNNGNQQTNSEFRHCIVGGTGEQTTPQMNGRTENPVINPRNLNSPAWQQSARAVMASGSNVWKNATNQSKFRTNKPTTNTPNQGQGQGTRGGQERTKTGPKRIICHDGPIATLESNWDPWLFAAESSSPRSLWRNGGNCMSYLAVAANAGCIVPGGVESVLKWSKNRPASGANAFGPGVPQGRPEIGLMRFDSALSINDNLPVEDFDNQSNNNMDISNNINHDNIQGSGGAGGGRGLGFFRSGLKKAQGAIERGVTTIAIRADGGKNPDWICASLHFQMRSNDAAVNSIMATVLGSNPNGRMPELADICLSRTEWAHLPLTSQKEQTNKGILFSIPLCVPDLGFLEAASAEAGTANINAGVRLSVRLYLRSGAALLKAAANAGLKREYCIGESTILYSDILRLESGESNAKQQVQTQTLPGDGENSFLQSGKVEVPMVSGMLAEISSPSQNAAGRTPAVLTLHGTSRIKLNPPCTLGWSLTDPTTTAPSMPLSWLSMFQLPLDQGYVFPLVHHHELLASRHHHSQHMSPPSLLLANERAVESTIILPLATAVSQLLSSAALRSQNLASIAATRMTRREGIRSYLVSNEDDPSKIAAVAEAALKDGCAEVEVGLVALVLLRDGISSGGSTNAGGGFGAAFAGVGGTGRGNGAQNMGPGLEKVPFAQTSIMFQRHDTIFEETIATGSAPLLDQASGTAYINNSAAGATGPREAISARFFPRVLTGLPENDEDVQLLPGVMGTKPNGKYVGTVRIEAMLGSVGSNTSNASFDLNGANGADTLTANSTSNAAKQDITIEGIVDVEPYLDNISKSTNRKQPLLVPAIDTNNGKRIGTFLFLIGANTPEDATEGNTQYGVRSPMPSASGGLISLVGMDVLAEEIGLSPFLDYNMPPATSETLETSTVAGIRRRQIATMGSFLSSRFLRHQAEAVRANDSSVFTERFEKYRNSVLSGLSSDIVTEDESDLPLFKRRTPMPFRPSNSRGEALLAGIGFNVHVHSLSLNILQDGKPAIPAATYHSVTHGAPADHAKGFGVQGIDGSRAHDLTGSSLSNATSLNSGARGGLRRLELRRFEIAKELEGSVSSLIGAVGEYFKSRAQFVAIRQQAGMKPSRHIPPDVPSILHYRSKTIECAQKLYSLTWDIAVRRGNCFSQALGIAVTSYLTSISDGGPAWRGYANWWVKHGYLITFEGLLSAVGKELGMIEDASVAVEMLRMVSVVLVPDDGDSGVRSADAGQQRIPVPYSPYAKWVHLVHLISQGSGSKTQYRLEIGLDPSFYQHRVPDPLKGNAAVRFFPVLYQMGVDIRQWGVNAGRIMASQIKDRTKGGGSTQIGEGEASDESNSGFEGSLIDDDDDDDDDEGDIADNEILIALNIEGFRKMNSYAHATIPTTGISAASSPTPAFYASEHGQMQALPTHPLLVPLSEVIKSSVGKMEHGVLDKSATVCQRLGGGSTVFCKSGKDRTAMQVTFKQAQFMERFMNKKAGIQLEDTPISYKSVFDNATLMRIHGTRVPICEKNAGEAKYAFNPLQAKFMPEMLKPPPITLAGFLKKPET